MSTAANVRVGVTGSINKADAGSTLPTDATSSIDGAFDELGYIGEDGVVQSIGADVTEIKAWQNGDVVRKIQTSHDLTYAFAFMETSAEVLEAYYGNFTGTVDDGTVEITADQLERGPWVLHVIDGDSLIRIVVSDGQITERGDVSYVNGEAVTYPVTLSCFPDENGVKAYMYIATDTGS